MTTNQQEKPKELHSDQNLVLPQKNSNCSDAKTAAEFAQRFLDSYCDSVITCDKDNLFVVHGTNHRIGEMLRSRLGDSITDYAVTDDGTTWAAIVRPSSFDKFEKMKINRILGIAEFRADMEEHSTRSVEPVNVEYSSDEDFFAMIEMVENADDKSGPAPIAVPDEADELMDSRYLTEGRSMLDLHDSVYGPNSTRVTCDLSRAELMALGLYYLDYFFAEKVCPHFMCWGRYEQNQVDFAWHRFHEIYNLLSPDAPIPLFEKYIQRWKDVDQQFSRDIGVVKQPEEARPWSVSEPYSDPPNSCSL